MFVCGCDATLFPRFVRRCRWDVLFCILCPEDTGCRRLHGVTYQETTVLVSITFTASNIVLLLYQGTVASNKKIMKRIRTGYTSVTDATPLHALNTVTICHTLIPPLLRTSLLLSLKTFTRCFRSTVLSFHFICASSSSDGKCCRPSDPHHLLRWAFHHAPMDQLLPIICLQ